MDNKKIGKFLRNLRQEQNLTQEELGEKLGATNKTISRWETGTYMPPADILLQLSKLYGVSVNEILCGERLATSNYQTKAEENIVTTINDNSVVSKRNKKILIICLSVILAITIVSAVLIATFVSRSNYITVTFDSKGGSSVEKYMLAKGDDDGYIINEPISPTLQGHSFVGWFYLKKKQNDVYEEARWDFSEDRVWKSMTLYAKWEVATDGLMFSDYTIRNTVFWGVFYAELKGYCVTGLDNTNATDVVIPAYYNGKPVIYIGERAFKSMPIKSVVIPNSVMGMGGACFADCTELVHVRIGKNIKEMGSAVFSGCTSLQNIDLPNTITSIPWQAFSGCTNLRWIIIPNDVKDISLEAFYGCKNLTSIIIGAKVSFIANDAFASCDSLVEICNYSVTELSDYSQFDGVLNKYKHGSGQSNLYFRNNDYLVYDDHTNEQILVKYYGEESDITLPETFDGRPYRMSDYAFYQSNVKSVTIPAAVKTISRYAFAECDNLTSVTLEDGITTVGEYAFYGCSNLRDVKISNNVTTIPEATFQDCVNLSDVDLGNSVTNIAYRAFANCTKLESIAFPETLQKIEWYAFYGSGLKDLALPSNLKVFDSRAFFNCSNLECITVSEENKQYSSEGNCVITNGDVVLGCKSSVIPESVKGIGELAFQECQGLQSIYIPSNVIHIISNPFRSCNNLLSITVSEDNPVYHSYGNCIVETATKTVIVMGKNYEIPSDGSVENIAGSVFAYDFENGEQIKLPNTITTIDFLTFYMGTNDKVDIVYDGTMEQWISVEIIYHSAGTEHFNLPMHVKNAICIDGVIFAITT